MRSRFGEVIRQNRIDAKMTLKDVADALGVSIVYLSDIERGNRPPFGPDKIRAVARLLGASERHLLVEAAKFRGVFEVDLDGASDSKLAAISGMARGGISDQTWDAIAKILNGDEPWRE